MIIEKGKRIAAETLEASEADIRFEDGRFIVAGTDRAIDLLRVGDCPRGRRSARHLLCLDPGMDDLPEWRSCRRGRD